MKKSVVRAIDRIPTLSSSNRLSRPAWLGEVMPTAATVPSVQPNSIVDRGSDDIPPGSGVIDCIEEDQCVKVARSSAR